MTIVHYTTAALGFVLFIIGMVFAVFSWLGRTWVARGTPQYITGTQSIAFGVFVNILGILLLIISHFV